MLTILNKMGTAVAQEVAQVVQRAKSWSFKFLLHLSPFLSSGKAFSLRLLTLVLDSLLHGSSKPLMGE